MTFIGKIRYSPTLFRDRFPIRIISFLKAALTSICAIYNASYYGKIQQIHYSDNLTNLVQAAVVDPSHTMCWWKIIIKYSRPVNDVELCSLLLPHFSCPVILPCPVSSVTTAGKKSSLFNPILLLTSCVLLCYLLQYFLNTFGQKSHPSPIISHRIDKIGDY